MQKDALVGETAQPGSNNRISGATFSVSVASSWHLVRVLQAVTSSGVWRRARFFSVAWKCESCPPAAVRSCNGVDGEKAFL